MLSNSNGVRPQLQMGAVVMGFVEDFRCGLHYSKRYIFCPIWNLLCENGNLKTNFSKKSYAAP